MLKKLLQNNRICYLNPNYVSKRYIKEAVLPELKRTETQFDFHTNKKPQREPIITSLLMKRFDEDFFYYPVTRAYYRYNDFSNWLKPIENYISICVDNKITDKEEILNHLREMEVFRSHIDYSYSGLDFSKAESLKLIEVLSRLPWLGTYIVKNYILPVQLISKYGTIEQKIKYFPKITSGEMIPTICINEGEYGTNINNIKSYVVQNSEDKWLLNGEKTFVVNGINSNLFLVIARNTHAKWLDNPDSFSLLLVERDFGNISCSDVSDTIGKHDTPTCTINFKDTLIPNENFINPKGSAFNILMEYLKPGNQNIAAQAISILRSFINYLIIDIRSRKQFDRNLYEFDIVKKTISEMAFNLYSMESITYFTSGIFDRYENQNVDLEQTITEAYCANKCLSCIQTGIQLIGARSYMKDNSYIQALHDAMALVTMDINNLDALTYIASTALQRFGKEVYSHVEKKRKSFYYPMYIIMDQLFNKTQKVDTIKNHLHPSLEISAQYLEENINLFKIGMEKLLIRNGGEITQKFVELYKISEILTEIYVLFANISRASRAFSEGVRNADFEKNVVVATSCIVNSKIKLILQSIEEGPLRSGDYYYENTADHFYENREYSLGHPLVKTF